MNPPSFINPSAEPLKASMDLQAKLESDIRKLIHLAVADTASRATAESKMMDNQGLEAGLSYIGLVLEAAERRIAEFWAAWGERNPSQRTVGDDRDPDHYSLKTDSDRITEAQSLVKLMYAVPGQKVKRELAENIEVLALLGGKISVGDIQAIFDEIDKAPYAARPIRPRSLRRSRPGPVRAARPAQWPWDSTTTSTSRPARTMRRGRFGFCRPSNEVARFGDPTTGSTKRDAADSKTMGVGQPRTSARRGPDEQRCRGTGRPRSFGQSGRWERREGDQPRCHVERHSEGTRSRAW